MDRVATVRRQPTRNQVIKPDCGRTRWLVSGEETRAYAVVVRGKAAGAVLAMAIAIGAALASAGAARAEPRELCRFDGQRLGEISGLAYSALHDGIVWAHNDSGGGPRIYALDVDSCEIRAVLRVRGIEARDPEAIAAGTGSTGAPVLWWGDIGDNTSARRSIEVHEVAEPADLRSGSVEATTYRVQLDEPQDAEALLADGDRLWLIGKGLIEGTVWELPHPLPPDAPAQARAVGKEEGLVTDAAMRPGGGYAVRDYSEVRIYAGPPPGTLVSRMPLPPQIQGEAMTWTPDGTALIVASEGDDRLLLVPIDDDAAAPDVSASATAEVEASSPEPNASGMPAETPNPSPVANALEPVDRVGSLAVLALAVGSGVFFASATAVAVAVRLRGRR